MSNTNPVITIVHNCDSIAPHFATCPMCGASIVFRTINVNVIGDDEIKVEEIEYTCYEDEDHSDFSYQDDGTLEGNEGTLEEKWDMETEKIIQWLNSEQVEIIID